ncbi:MAG TPA: TolC family protein, partial [Syntrophobacteraceae bacterium]|nr:TolC family protein [Syntrophobacteraceae bacterium]
MPLSASIERLEPCPHPGQSPEAETGRSPRERLWGLAWLCGLCLLWMAGCMVGPNYQPPRSEVPSEWKGVEPGPGGVVSRAVRGAGTLVEWWKSFEDPALVSLIERGIDSNPDLRQATARIREARAARGMGSSALWPSVESGASYLRSGPLTSRSRTTPVGGSSVISGGTVV